MENASKALIIAGAILISILIIALGVFIYNNAANTVKSADMTEYEIQAFNEKFTKYIDGNTEKKQNITYANANGLVQAIRTNNSNSNNKTVTIQLYNRNNSKTLINDYNSIIQELSEYRNKDISVKPIDPNTSMLKDGMFDMVGLIIEN